MKDLRWADLPDHPSKRLIVGQVERVNDDARRSGLQPPRIGPRVDHRVHFDSHGHESMDDGGTDKARPARHQGTVHSSPFM
jgi:hypothetical protein